MAEPDREDPHLHRREPERERAGEVLDQDPDEALERADQRAVDHHRRVLGVVGALVAEPEALRHLEVELDRPDLPGAVERVEHVQVDLRPVEGAVALVHDVLEPAPLERGGEGRLGDVPLLVGAELVLRPRRELDLDLEPELVVDRVAELEAAEHLVLDLLGRAEDVRVVLREHPHAQQAVERAGQLVAVQHARLGHPQRQLAVAVGAVGVERAVARAVHRLQPELAVLGLEREHVLAVLLPVARGDPELLVVDQRRAHLDVAALAVLAAAQVLEHVPDHHPLRVPERRARRDVGEVEQVELRPEPAVVALPRLLEPLRGARRGRPGVKNAVP